MTTGNQENGKKLQRGAVFLLFVLLLLLWIKPIHPQTYGPLSLSQYAGKFPYDWGGHGTSIASVVSQIAPDVELLIIKFYDPPTMGKVPPSRWTANLMEES